MSKEKITNYDFINAYKKMRSLSNVCKENNIDQSNLIRKKITSENEKIIVDELKKEIMKLFDIIILGGI